MTNTAAIATKLNVIESAIVRVEEWANVMFVVVKGLGARFVSKKVVKKMNKQEVADKICQILADENIKTRQEFHGETRIYIGSKGSNSGYVVLANGQVQLTKLNNSVVYDLLRDGTREYEQNKISAPQYQRTVCLNCNRSNTIIIGYKFCTDCYGECD